MFIGWGLAWAAAPVIRAEVGTDVPLDVSAGLLTEFGPRIRLRAAVGYLPRPYLRAANSAAQSLFDGYTDPYRELVEAGLDDAVLFRVHAGVRPVARWGLYAHAGWSHLAASGDATGSEVVEAVTDEKLPIAVGAVALAAREVVEMVDVDLGWEEALGDSPVTLRAGLGWSFSVAAAASLEADTTARLPLAAASIDALEEAGAVEIERATTAYVHPPRLTLALGWNFQ